MASYTRKRVRDGRVELFEAGAQRWVPLATIAESDRPQLEDLPREKPESSEVQPETESAAARKERAQAIAAAMVAQAKQPRQRSRKSLWIVGGALLLLLLTLILVGEGKRAAIDQETRITPIE